jgi:type VI secretion system protein ImpE
VLAQELFKAGKLEEAIQSLGVELRDNPADVQRRTFLFELLSLAGDLDRAEKQLDVVAAGNPEAGMGALVYRSAIHADRTRRQMFDAEGFPTGDQPVTVAGTLNGTRFASLRDADPRIGARLEVYAAGQYTWIPFEHLASITMEAPKRLRDLIWAPAIVRPGPGFQQLKIELGDVLLPAMTPLSWQHTDNDIRLGRVTDWEETDGGDVVPVGQKLLLVDDDVIPILELRELEIDQTEEAND